MVFNKSLEISKCNDLIDFLLASEELCYYLGMW